MMKIIISLMLFSIVSSASTPQRISSTVLNKGTVVTVYIASGLGTMITFPCHLDEVFAGNKNDIFLEISAKNRSHLLVSSSSGFVRATNFFAKCEGGGSPFVFDLVPNKNIHQDLLEIRSSYGSPHLSDKRLTVKASSESNEQQVKVVLKKPALIKYESGK